MKSEMERVAAAAISKSEKMRRLAAAGYSRQEIADFLGVRYQFVRNVLVEQERKQVHIHAGLAEAGHPWTAASKPEAFAGITVMPDGSAVIPAFVLAEAGLRPGNSFVPDVVGDGDIRLLAGEAALRRAQELVRQSLGGKASLVDEILQERRREARDLARDAGQTRG